MDNTALQAQLADYISACAFEPFQYTDQAIALQLFTIRTPQSFSKPVIEFSEALEKKLVEVSEINEHGSVQELSVSNLSNSYLLIYEGTILQGGKQNRVINATQLIPPHSRHTIPASCIEHGRWHRTSTSFRKSSHHSPSFLRKSIRNEIKVSKSVRGNQSQVWDEIKAFSIDRKLTNSSGDFEDIYNRSDKSGQLFPSGLPLPPTEGVLLQVDGEYTLDLVANEPVFGKVFPQISSGYEQAKTKGNATLANGPGEVLAKYLKTSPCHVLPAVAAGTDVRIETPVGNFSALLYEGEVVSATLTAA